MFNRSRVSASTPFPFERPSGASATTKFALTICTSPSTFGSLSAPYELMLKRSCPELVTSGSNSCASRRSTDPSSNSDTGLVRSSSGSEPWNCRSVPVPFSPERSRFEHAVYIVRMDRPRGGQINRLLIVQAQLRERPRGPRCARDALSARAGLRATRSLR